MRESKVGETGVDTTATSTEPWREAEWQCVNERRKRAFSSETAGSRNEEPDNLAGLALSGGGIRSALFNDGFLQALSHRGLLRYFDYLCSVSGGGYIAGHLASQADEDSKTCFHDDPARSELGRNPVTGRVDPSRLAGIGGYLSRPLEFIPAYLWSFFFSLAFYLGIVGVIATLAALSWRSLDNIAFREVYIESLGLDQFGDELLIAFLPTVFFLGLTVAGEGFLSLLHYLYVRRRRVIKRWHRRFRAFMLLTIMVAVLASVAIYMGNGKSITRSGTTVYLNNYVQIIAISAGVIQILVFLGRDRLFRSERAEAKSWQRHLQQSVTTVVVLFLVFSMVHWMGRENISGYTDHRDPHLVVGDVKDWPRLAAIRAEFSGLKSNEEFFKLNEIKVDKVHPMDVEGSWHGSLVRSRLNVLGLDEIKAGDYSEPSPPVVEDLKNKDMPRVVGYSKTWWLPRRVIGAAYAYWECVVLPKFASERLVDSIEEEGDLANLDDSIKSQMKQVVSDYTTRRSERRAFLSEFNPIFQTRSFTAYLLTRIDKIDSKTVRRDSNLTNKKVSDWLSQVPVAGENTVSKVSKFFESSNVSLSDSQRKELWTVLHSLKSPVYPTMRPAHTSEDKSIQPKRKSTAKLNRILVEAIYPNVIQSHAVASTFVVPPYDQRTRVRWLLGWTLLSLLGLIGGLGSSRVATVFYFYRKQLSLNFLVPTWKPETHRGKQSLGKITPHCDGLPYPLILAAALEPSSCNGSYQIAARPFVFSPLASGSFEEGEVPIPSDQLSFSRNPEGHAVTLADCVTLSGAAVTPLMTQNRWLTMILDFFNTGIGQTVRRNDRTSSGPAETSRLPLFSSLLAGALVLGAGFYLLQLRWSLLLVLPTIVIFLRCWHWKIGSPGLIRSLFLVKEAHHDTGFNQNQSFYIADGGYVDYLGVSELLRRRCELIVVSDAGANVGDDSLGTLARMCERASKEQGVRFLDLDHEAPIDFGRLEIDKETRLVHQPFICMRVRYPDADRPEGMLVYCQMSITKSDPIEIKNIRNLFPSFPDEPTVNQFYNEKQVSAYRDLGYHIGSRVCSELYAWFNVVPTQTDEAPSVVEMTERSAAQIRNSRFRQTSYAELFSHQLKSDPCREASRFLAPSKQPLFRVMNDRILTSYRLACFQELSYKEDDIFGEAVWTSNHFAFPSFQEEVRQFRRDSRSDQGFADWWLARYELNADVRSAYRTAVIHDINALELEIESFCGALWQTLHVEPELTSGHFEQRAKRLAAHLTCVAVACQEVHRGRPHAAFQVGGRLKLVDLCVSIAEIVAQAAPQQTSDGRNLQDLFNDIDKTIAELIEMERSIFQGGEHVATISFAQCMSNAWGKMARDLARSENAVESVVEVTKAANAFGIDGSLGMFERQCSTHTELTESTDLMAAEIRHQLDVGMKGIQLKAIRHGLAKSWYLGFMDQNGWQKLADFSPKPESDQATETSTAGRGSPKARKKKAGSGTK